MAALRALVLLGLLSFAAAECPNACSGHGDCTAYDKCTCYRNWQAADCSQRTCPFGLAHVDVPKGDLDGSADALADPVSSTGDANLDAIVHQVDVYGTWGTTEKYPLMVDSNGTVLTNTAHWYVECSNKGLCDRKSGLCKCFTGYEGSSCQRASCPNDCSGHGTCQTIETIAKWDHGNEYKLWDRDMTMGCYCDPGYMGADCSLRQCKVGIDPLYTNLYTTANIASWRIKFNITAGTDESNIVGTYAIKFFDSFGEDYITTPIVHQQSDYSSAIEAALEALPGGVVPLNSVKVNYTTYDTTAEYSVTFTKNPGQLKQIEVLTHLDGDRATLFDTAHSTTANIRAVDVEVFNAGSPGEYTDYFTTFCEGVTAYVTNSVLTYGTDSGALHYASRLRLTSSYQARLLKQCLGDSDGDSLNNVDVENWDTGAQRIFYDSSSTLQAAVVGRYPHALKLVKQERSDIYDSGHTYLAWYSNSTAVTSGVTINGASVVFEMNLLSRHPLTHASNTPYYVFTTDAIAEKVMVDADQDGDFSGWEDGPVVAWWKKYTNVIYTHVDASCEKSGYTSHGRRVSSCISKGDLLFIPAGYFGNERSASTYDTGYVGDLQSGNRLYEWNREYTGQLYTVTKVWTEPVSSLTSTVEDRFRIQLDKNINWDGSQLGNPWGRAFDNSGGAWRTGYQNIFKFTPGTSYTYVSECSNRGVCDRTSGLCNCFKGYTNDNCDTQSALAI